MSIVSQSSIVSEASISDISSLSSSNSFSVYDAPSDSTGGRRKNKANQESDSTSLEGRDNVLSAANNLLAHIGLNTKKISSIDELQRVASSYFVAVHESIFKEKVPGIIRNPQTRDQYVSNAQLIVDTLCSRYNLDLIHITGEAIVSGQLNAILNLIQLLFWIVLKIHK